LEGSEPQQAPKPFYVLALDGGGSKGIYTIGILKELEAALGVPLCQRFNLIFGTSTGAIIAALIGLGTPCVEIEKLYLSLIPDVMGHWFSFSRTRALKRHAKKIFGDKKFDALKTDIGIVATNTVASQPMIFKTSVRQAYSLQATFEPGFGCTIAEAVLASSAALPFFRPVRVNTANQGDPTLLDGGFVANNPTLMAVAEAHRAFMVPLPQLRVLSLGVGHYKEPKRNWHHELLYWLWPFRIIQTMFPSSSNTSELLRSILFSDLQCVRVDGSYPDAQHATDMLESDPAVLSRLSGLGRDSFSKQQSAILALLS
jgi:predicted acylesterase/phospholipase RssA